VTPTLDELYRVVTALKLRTPLPRWNGDVRLHAEFLPYEIAERCDMCGGDGLTSDGFDTCWKCDGKRVTTGTVHAVVFGGVMFVSQQAWDALQKEAHPSGEESENR